MAWLLTLLGAALVLAALRDIFHTLWHPRGFGSLGRFLFRLVWEVLRRLNRSRHPTDLAGPVGALVTAVAWTVLIGVGWALVYLPHLPERFHFGNPPSPGSSSDVVASIYLSLVTLATLGFGDIVPATPVLRVLVPLEALIGFVLLTAAISWILQIYPALIRRRALARRLSILRQQPTTPQVITSGEASVATQLLASVTDAVTMIEIDLTQYGETYFFRESHPDVALAATASYALHLADLGRQAPSAEVRHAAGVLEQAMGSLAVVLDGYVSCGGSTREVLGAVAADHGHQPVVDG